VRDEMGQEMILVEFQCCLCHSSFPSLSDVVNHVKDQHNIIVRLCKICGSGFETSLQCRDHEHFCNGRDIMSCEECGLKVGSLHSLLAHTHCHRTIHSNKTIYKMSEEYNEEVNQAQAIRQVKCIRCGDNCNAKKVHCWYCYYIVDHDVKHMDEFHPFTPSDSLWVYTCKNLPPEDSQDLTVICAKDLNDESQLSYKCYKCNNHFQSSDEIDVHLKFKVCTHCEMGLLRLRLSCAGSCIFL
jgi:DNA-directed RNA polymerase subunit RPC12/RpoP